MGLVRRGFVAVVAFAGLCLLSGCLSLKPGPPPLQSGDAYESFGLRLDPLRAGGKGIRAKDPVDLQFLPESWGKILVISERKGLLQWFDLETGRAGTLLRIEDVGSSYVEKGLVGFAFSPDFDVDRKLVTHHLRPTSQGGASVITEWVVSGERLEQLKAGEGRILLEVAQPQEGHNGGQVGFGPDGYLYVAFGDGGFQRDPQSNSQNRENFLGSILRIDPSPSAGERPYSIPADNPFVGGGHLPEVYAFGFRNPWRWSFGPDGRLILADVGQDRREEINLVEAGGNYGWCIVEGSLPHPSCPSSESERAATKMPLLEYGRTVGTAIIGGYVYDGTEIPELKGLYLYGDHSNGKLWALKLPVQDGSSLGPDASWFLGETGLPLVTFGRDPEGELYLATLNGRLFRLQRQD